MEEPTVKATPSAPVSPPPAPLSRKTLIIGGIVAAVIIVIVAAVAFIKIDGSTIFERLAIQNELRGILVADWAFETIMPHAFGFKELASVEIPGVQGALGDYATGGNVSVGLSTSAESGLHEVWLLGSEPKVLTSGDGAKASVAVSPDGTFAAYAARTDADASFSSELSAWTVHIIDLTSGKDIELGTGFDPEFFVREGVPYILFTSPEGIVVNALTERDSFSGFITPFTFVDRVDGTVKISPDGTHLALKDSVTRQYSFYSIYRVATDLPLGIEPVLFPQNRYGDITFANNVAYGIDNRTQGTATVWKIDLAKTTETKIYTFPTMLPNRFLR